MHTKHINNTFPFIILCTLVPQIIPLLTVTLIHTLVCRDHNLGIDGHTLYLNHITSNCVGFHYPTQYGDKGEFFGRNYFKLTYLNVTKKTTLFNNPDNTQVVL